VSHLSEVSIWICQYPLIGDFITCLTECREVEFFLSIEPQTQDTCDIPGRPTVVWCGPNIDETRRLFFVVEEPLKPDLDDLV
jgi:hypothetical protein